MLNNHRRTAVPATPLVAPLFYTMSKSHQQLLRLPSPCILRGGCELHFFLIAHSAWVPFLGPRVPFWVPGPPGSLFGPPGSLFWVPAWVPFRDPRGPFWVPGSLFGSPGPFSGPRVPFWDPRGPFWAPGSLLGSPGTVFHMFLMVFEYILFLFYFLGSGKNWKKWCWHHPFFPR